MYKKLIFTTAFLCVFNIQSMMYKNAATTFKLHLGSIKIDISSLIIRRIFRIFPPHINQNVIHFPQLHRQIEFEDECCGYEENRIMIARIMQQEYEQERDRQLHEAIRIKINAVETSAFK